MKKRVLYLTSALGVLTLAAGGAQAATAAAAAGAADQSVTTLQDLVVTAEKREQNLQDVPVAISAYTSAKRDLVGISSVQDMTNFTPGLQYSSQTDRISLRGVGRLNNSHAADSAVAVYSDSIYSTSTVQAGETPIFIDRVEVLRGPQGTLYGRASVGGAINIISRKPTKEPYAEIRARYENYNHSLLEGAVSGPLGEHVQFRLAGNWERQTKGWFENTASNNAPDEGGIINTFFIEGQLSIQFSDKLETWAKVSVIGWHNGSGGPGSNSSWSPYSYNTTLFNTGGLLPNTGFAYSGNAAVSNVVTSCGPVNPALLSARKVCHDSPNTVKLTDTIIVANHWTYHADNFDIKYITGGTHYHYQLTGDQDGSGVQSWTQAGVGTIHSQYTFNYQEIERWWSHELNIVSTGDGPFQWLLGAFYYNESYEQPVYTQLADEPLYDTLVNGNPAAVQDPLRRVFDNRPHFDLRSRAVFTQVDWKMADTLKMTVGLRLGDDWKRGYESVRIVDAPGIIAAIPFDVTPFIGGSGGPGPSNPGVVSLTTDAATGFKTRVYDAKFSALTGTAVLQWTPREGMMLYAKYSRGYKAGGFRVGIDTSLGGNPETQKETINAYEFGLKTNIGRTFQVDADVFYYDYRNAQVPLSQPATGAGPGSVANSILFNVPKARSIGVELETIWQPIDNLQILANYSYLDATIQQGLGVDPADTCAENAAARQTVDTGNVDNFCGTATKHQFFQSLVGYHMPNSAAHRVTLNANYTWRMDKGNLTASATYVWRGPQFGSIFDRSYYRAPSWSQIDARLTWKASNDKYTVILYGKNLANTLGYANGAGAIRQPGRPTPGNYVSAYELTPPRTYGIELQYKFF